MVGVILALSLVAPVHIVPATATEIPLVPRVEMDVPLSTYLSVPLSPPESAPEAIPVPLDVTPHIGEPILSERTLSFALPVLVEQTTREILSRPHHDYPAADIVVPVGTTIHAVTGGQITMATTNDGGACGGTIQITNDLGLWTYCHLSGILVSRGDIVLTGWDIGLSGGRLGARGSGSSTVPHVHVAWLRNGRLVCPQPLFLSIWDGEPPNLTVSTRCVS